MARYGVTDLKARPSKSSRSPANRSKLVLDGAAFTTRTSASSRCLAAAGAGAVEVPAGDVVVPGALLDSVRSHAAAIVAMAASDRMTMDREIMMHPQARGRGGSVMPGFSDGACTGGSVGGGSMLGSRSTSLR